MPEPVTINRSRLVRGALLSCLLAEIALVLLDLIFNDGSPTYFLGARRFCNIAREDSLASLFGTVQTLFLGLTAWLIYWIVKRSPSTKWRKRGWFVLALFFTLAAIDDGSELHERLGSTFEIMKDLRVTEGAMPSAIDQLLSLYPSYPWQVLYGPPLIVIGLFLLVFLCKELDSTLLRLGVLAGLACLVVAIGLDFIEGLEDPYSTLADWVSVDMPAIRHYSKVLEEFLEMFGITLLLGALLAHFMKTAGTLTLIFQDSNRS